MGRWADLDLVYHRGNLNPAKTRPYPVHIWRQVDNSGSAAAAYGGTLPALLRRDRTGFAGQVGDQLHKLLLPVWPPWRN